MPSRSPYRRAWRSSLAWRPSSPRLVHSLTRALPGEAPPPRGHLPHAAPAVTRKNRRRAARWPARLADSGRSPSQPWRAHGRAGAGAYTRSACGGGSLCGDVAAVGVCVCLCVCVGWGGGRGRSTRATWTRWPSGSASRRSATSPPRASSRPPPAPRVGPRPP